MYTESTLNNKKRHKIKWQKLIWNQLKIKHQMQEVYES